MLLPVRTLRPDFENPRGISHPPVPAIRTPRVCLGKGASQKDLPAACAGRRKYPFLAEG